MTDGGNTLEQWQNFWTIPLIFALVVTLLFAFGFREKTESKRTAVIFD
jgi:formate-dependent nitrite reductase membrane component NrfD